MARKYHPYICICIFITILCPNFLASEKCPNDNTYVMRSVGPNNYAVDATDPKKITIQEFASTKAQAWKFQPTDTPGSYFIVNEKHGKVLDFELRDGALYLILNDKKETSMQQQWNLSHKGQIVNLANGKNVDIVDAKFTPGNHLVLWEDNGCSCQKFFFPKKE